MEEEISKKVILIGLDNAGKTTIISSMKKAQGPEVFDLKPTKGVNIEEFKTVDTEGFSTGEVSVIVWDFGGQDIYREEYLHDPEKYFSDIDKAIYVIDIQGKNRFKISLEYLRTILKYIRKYNKKENIDFWVFLHKFDPILVNDVEYQSRSKSLKEEVKKLFAPYPYPLKIYETSIYTVFQKIEVI